MEKITTAILDFDAENRPISPLFGDIYHTNAGALQQAESVFLAGNGLPQGWRNRHNFVILELGFGFGVNFLATLKAWKNDAESPKFLEYFAIEKFPLKINDFLHFHPLKNFKELDEIAAQYPPAAAGFYTLTFEHGNKHCLLRLILGDVEKFLPTLDAKIDAIFLDGFSPAKNPEMWTENVAKALWRLSFYGTTLASWSVSGAVRRNLESSEFALKKEKGLGQKRERLTGFFRSQRVFRPFFAMPENAPKRAIVVGAGLAGCCTAHFLARYGFEVFVLDSNGVAAGASGNHSGLLHPALSVDDNRLSQLTRQGFFFALRFLKNFPQCSKECGIFHLALDSESSAKMQKIAENGVLPPENLQFCSDLAAFKNHKGALFYKNGALAQPAKLCRELLKNPKIHFFPFSFNGLEKTASGLWKVDDSIPESPIVVLALGNNLSQFIPEIALIPARGQVCFAKNDLSLKHAIISRKGYIVPTFDGKMTIGASFVLNDSDCDFRESEKTEILQNLAELFPPIQNVETWETRAATRALSPDRLPIVGQLPNLAIPRLLKTEIKNGENAENVGGVKIVENFCGIKNAENFVEIKNGENVGGIKNAENENVVGNGEHSGIFCLGGFGARGMVWAPFLAEFLSAQIAGLSSSLPSWAKKTLSPDRFFQNPR